MIDLFMLIYMVLQVATPVAFVSLALLVHVSGKRTLANRIWVGECLLLAGLWGIVASTNYIDDSFLALVATKVAMTCGAGADQLRRSSSTDATVVTRNDAWIFSAKSAAFKLRRPRTRRCVARIFNPGECMLMNVIMTRRAAASLGSSSRNASAVS